jgi:hypothetical protein
MHLRRVDLFDALYTRQQEGLNHPISGLRFVAIQGIGPLTSIAEQGIFPEWSSWTDNLSFAEVETVSLQSL